MSVESMRLTTGFCHLEIGRGEERVVAHIESQVRQKSRTQDCSISEELQALREGVKNVPPDQRMELTQISGRQFEVGGIEDGYYRRILVIYRTNMKILTIDAKVDGILRSTCHVDAFDGRQALQTFQTVEAG